MKQNVKLVIICLIISIFLGALNYFVTANIYFSIILTSIFFVFSIIFLLKSKEKGDLVKNRSLECVAFINKFIITLSIHKNINGTFETLEESFSPNLKEQVKLIEHLDVMEKLNYLEKYFKANLYKVFYKIIQQYSYNGGDILNISQLLIYDCRKIEDSVLEYDSVRKRKLIEFISLWGVTYLIVIALRLALGDFFNSMMELEFFPIGMFTFNLIFMVAFLLFMRKYYDFEFVKGDFKIEKTKAKNRKSKSKLQKRDSKTDIV